MSMTITQMQEEISNLLKRLGDKKAAVELENREPNEEERDKAVQLLDRIDELEKNIAVEERLQETQGRLSKPKVEPTKPPVHTTTVTPAEQKKKDSFLSFGEQLRAVARAGDGTGPGIVDPRLQHRAISGLGESVASDGGFLVQADFASELIKNVFETGKLASRIRKITLGAGKNSLKFNGMDESSRATGSRWGGVQMYWLDEAGTKTKSKPKFKQIELSLKKLIGLCYASDELLEDASSLAQIIQQSFSNEMNFMIDEATINGTGAGMPLGILNSPGLVTQGKESAQAATTIVWENIIKMWSRLLADSRANAVWLINQDCEPQLASMSLAAGTGGIPVYMPAGGFAGATATPFSTLLGRPVIPIEQAQTLGTKGDIFLADFTNGYVAIDKGGMKQDYSIHVRYVNDEGVFRFVYRYDGQPVMSKSITPFKGTNNIGHFITLATRS